MGSGVERVGARVAVLMALAVAVVASSAACQGGDLRIDQVEPPFGNIAGNDAVVIIGQGFRAGLNVHFNKRAAKSVIVESAQRVRVKTPPGLEGPADVIIIDDAGRTHQLGKGFTYRKET